MNQLDSSPKCTQSSDFQTSKYILTDEKSFYYRFEQDLLSYDNFNLYMDATFQNLAVGDFYGGGGMVDSISSIQRQLNLALQRQS